MIGYDRRVSDYAERIHSARNLLATIIGNLDYARSLASSESTTSEERNDLVEALSHAQMASTQLLAEIERFK